jgi:ribosomal protein S12 methylthiotransferase
MQQVIVDSAGPKRATGRTAGDAPEIDGVVHIRSGRRRITAGDFVDVKITAADEHDLHGIPA